MLTFLRKARKSLLDSLLAGKAGDSARKYFLYAIGEVALVVIGILIALQINNWNEERKEGKEERKILNELLKTFKSDQEEFRNLMKYMIEIDQGYYDILNYVDKDLPYSDSLNSKFLWLTQLRPWNYDKTAFSSLQNKGIELIKDDSIRQYIVNVYEYRYPRLVGSFENFEANIREYSRPIIRKHFRIETTAEENYENGNAYVPINFEELKRMTEFRNIIIALKYSNKYQIGFCQNSIDGLSRIIEKIEEYLNE